MEIKKWLKSCISSFNRQFLYDDHCAIAIERLTNQAGLSALTFSAWNCTIHYLGLFRRTRAWCVECYREWDAKGEIIYDKLIWYIKEVDICLKHRIPFSTKCPHCGDSTVKRLGIYRTLKYCQACHRSLIDNSDRRAQADQKNLAELEWTAQNIEHLLFMTPHLTPENHENARTFIPLVIKLFFDGDAISFARHLNVNIYRAGLSSQPGWKPKLKELLNICRFYSLSLIDLFTKTPLAALTREPIKYRKFPIIPVSAVIVHKITPPIRLILPTKKERKLFKPSFFAFPRPSPPLPTYAEEMTSNFLALEEAEKKLDITMERINKLLSVFDVRGRTK